jgi:hypothetical protein
MLTDRLPVSVKIGDRDYPVDTRASTAINCLRKLREDVPEEAKLVYLQNRYGLPPSLEATTRIYDFLDGPPSETVRQPERPGVRFFDYFQDAPLIVAAFQQAYGLGLDEITSMHWWRFLALFQGLPGNTRFTEVVSIRTMEISAKDPADVKARKRRAKLAVALKDTRTKEQRKIDVQRQLGSLGL